MCDLSHKNGRARYILNKLVLYLGECTKRLCFKFVCIYWEWATERQASNSGALNVVIAMATAAATRQRQQQSQNTPKHTLTISSKWIRNIMSDASCRKRKRLKYTFKMHFCVLSDDYIPKAAKYTPNSVVLYTAVWLRQEWAKEKKWNIYEYMKWKKKEKKAEMKEKVVFLTRFLPNGCVLLWGNCVAEDS